MSQSDAGDRRREADNWPSSTPRVPLSFHSKPTRPQLKLSPSHAGQVSDNFFRPKYHLEVATSDRDTLTQGGGKGKV